MANVKIYTKVGCPYCAAAKEDMERRGIAYDELDVKKTPGAGDEAQKLANGRRVVPVIVEGDKVTLGFNGGG